MKWYSYSKDDLGTNSMSYPKRRGLPFLEKENRLESIRADLVGVRVRVRKNQYLVNFGD